MQVCWYNVQIKTVCGQNVLKNIYYSLIYLHLVYAVQVWESVCVSEMNKILVLRKRALCIITYNDNLPTVPGPLHPSTPVLQDGNFENI